jgi:hypothetical protein
MDRICGMHKRQLKCIQSFDLKNLMEGNHLKYTGIGRKIILKRSYRNMMGYCANGNEPSGYRQNEPLKMNSAPWYKKLGMEIAGSLETLISTHYTTWHHNPISKSIMPCHFLFTATPSSPDILLIF